MQPIFSKTYNCINAWFFYILFANCLINKVIGVMLSHTVSFLIIESVYRVPLSAIAHRCRRKYILISRTIRWNIIINVIFIMEASNESTDSASHSTGQQSMILIVARSIIRLVRIELISLVWWIRGNFSTVVEWWCDALE